MRKVRLLDPRSLIIYILVAGSFLLLWQSRYNNAAPEGTRVQNFELSTLDGKRFSTSEINQPILLIFFNTKTFLTSNIFPKLYLKRMSELKLIERAGYMEVIVLLDVEQSEEKVLEVLSEKKYKVLENTVYLGNTEPLADYLGVNSWPHFFLLDEDKNIIYQDKVPSIEKLVRILKGV
ncbi:TlpA family protein disulfide reductase [Limisalsivibrio acetivorans]|uniref:TlpA family protein disulfide reductase n=1 Tax=Limisalsivibrio acetivorans TaxID=1304888 RepID=UPI0003B6B008|nr:redoxin domain-containing protein [Limisalsivibrio acetivorans]